MIWQLTLLDAQGNIETFETTDDHPWHVSEGHDGAAGNQGNFLRTDELAVGMVLSTQDGDGVSVIEVIKTTERAPTYNLTVADAHTFFVGNDGIWVHNTDCFIGPPPRLAGRLRNKLKRIRNQNAARGNRGVSGTVSNREADAPGKNWVGENARVSHTPDGTRILISADGKRQFRYPSTKTGINRQTGEPFSKTGQRLLWRASVHIVISLLF